MQQHLAIPVRSYRLSRSSLALATLLCAAVLLAMQSPSAQAASKVLIVDTHIDAPIRMHFAGGNPSNALPEANFDHPRAVAGGLGTGFMSIFIPPDVDAKGEGLPLAHALIDRVEGLVQQSPDRFALVTCPHDVYAARKKGLIGLALGMENGGPIGGDLTRLQQLHQRGIRYVGLAHGASNALSDSSYDTKRPLKGLSQAGRAAIREMNNLGILVDVSHLSDDAFWEVMDESIVPAIASHSSMRHFIPGFERNMDDRMVETLVSRGGVVQINFGSGFLTKKAHDWEAAFKAAAAEKFASRTLSPMDPERQTFAADYRTANPYPYATIDDVIDHIDHVVSIAGINGVGIGSDFDGVGDTLPIGLKSVADYPNLIEGLKKRGYSKRAIAKVMGGNLMRTWLSVERYASEHGTRPRCSI